METLVINIPDAKSSIVKQVLHSLGVSVSGDEIPVKSDYKARLLQVSVWSEDDLRGITESGLAFNGLKPQEW